VNPTSVNEAGHGFRSTVHGSAAALITEQAESSGAAPTWFARAAAFDSNTQEAPVVASNRISAVVCSTDLVRGQEFTSRRSG
jgi:hypothetical protein